MPSVFAFSARSAQAFGASGPYQAVVSIATRAVQRAGCEAAKASVALTTNRVGSMFGFFFTAEKNVSRFAQVGRCDIERFKRFFHLMLDEGVYLAPSAYEAGFMSGAHTEADIDQTVVAFESAIRELKSEGLLPVLV